MGRGYFILKREKGAGKLVCRKITVGQDTDG